MRVEVIAPRSRRFDDVIELHRRYRKTLGFLPAAAFAEYADDGTLLGAIDGSNRLVAYALYDLPRNEIALRHLCVDTAARNSGLARRLVDELIQRHPDRVGVRVSCRRDWPANSMWPRLDFEPLNERPGRSAEGLPLTTWWRDLGQPSLFALPPDESSALFKVALDTDVFIDLGMSRAGGEESENLLTDWVLELVELVITKEVVQEINNHDDADVRKRQRGRLTGFRRADTPDSMWLASERALLDRLAVQPKTEHDRADVRHLARARAGGATYFLTRDAPSIKRLASAARESLGISVMNPAAFLQELWSLDQPLAYAPATLANTTFEIVPFPTDQEAHAIGSFVNRRGGERPSDLRTLLRSFLAQPKNWDVLLVRDSANEARGLVVRGLEKQTLRIPILRVAGAAQPTMARHLLHLQRGFAAKQGRTVLSIEDENLSAEVTVALRDEEFATGPNRWTAATLAHTGDPHAVASSLRAIQRWPELRGNELAQELLSTAEPDRSLVAQIERLFWPLKVACPTLPTFLIPVRAAFAEQLFDTELSEQTLFPRDDSLGLSREHVYYRSPMPAVVSAPARILWYVSKEKRVPGTGAVRACSALVEVAVDRPRTLHRRFRRLGVYKQRDVEATAKDGTAMAIRFGNTELFRSAIPLDELRQLASATGNTLSVRSPWKLPERMFEEVYRRGNVE